MIKVVFAGKNKKDIPKKSGIYCIKNIVNGRIYIGSTTNLRTRFNSHLWALNNKKHSNQKLQRDWDKSNKNNFIFETLEIIAEPNGLLELEQKWIDKQIADSDKCYNICSIAYSRLGTKFSQESKEKMSKAWTQKRKEEFSERSRKLGLFSLFGERNPFYGKHHTEETKNKISKTNKGKKLTEEHKKKIKDTFSKKYGGAPNKGKFKTQKEKEKDRLLQTTRISFLAVNVVNNELLKFNSIREASAQLRIPARHYIGFILKNPYKKNGGYRTYKNWRFYYED